MNTGFFVDLITRKPALLAAMLAFNGLDGGCVPKAWPVTEAVQRDATAGVVPPLPDELTAVPGLAVAAIWCLPGVRRRYSAAPSPEAGAILQSGFWDFADERHRLALLDAPTLKRLAWVFGTAVHAADIAKTIIREQVMELREALGNELYRYALHRGQYQLGDMADVFREADQRSPLILRIERHGTQALEACCQVWPDALRQRAAPRLGEALPSLNSALPDGPRPAPDPFTTVKLPRTVHRTLWFSLKKLLLKEVAPQWAPYFD